MKEKLIEKNLRIGVEKQHGVALKFIPTYAKGFPDRIVIMPGNRIWFVELKTTGKTLEPHQELWEGWLKNLGCKHRVVDDKISLQTFLNEISA